MPWLVAGLGNPGDRYAETRHNLGRMVVELLAERAGARFKKARFIPADVAEIVEGGERVFLVRSTLFMNESGTSFAGLAKKHQIPPDRLIAVYDELEIPPGELSIRFDGGTAGHNGVKSLRDSLRTTDFFRVRVGVGRPPGQQDPADFILEPIAKKLRIDVELWVDRAADATRSLIADGLGPTQDRFNRQAPSL
jgi:peptidyl-tRNA hydrolase, PTH1 family